MKLVKSNCIAPALKGERCCYLLRASLVFYVFFSLQGRGYSTPIALLDSANAAYAKGNFERACSLYEEIGKMGYEAAEVYFNLGNAYFKLDRIGMSVVNYERAKKLSPYDEDINFNIKLVNQRTLDKIEPMPKLFLEEWWDNLKNMHSEKTWGVRSIISFMIFLFFLGVFITSGKTFTKQLGFWLSILFFVFSTFFFFVSKSSYSSMYSQSSAVILSSSAEVKNAPSETGKKLFILHEGTKVSAPNSKGEWVKIELSPEKVGWVKRSAIEFI